MQGMETAEIYYHWDKDGEQLTEEEVLQRIIRDQESALRALAEIALRIAPRKVVN